MKSFPRYFPLNKKLSIRLAMVTAMLIILSFGCVFLPSAAAQQNTPEYQVSWIPTPIETASTYFNGFTTANDAEGVTDLAFVVGWQLRSDRPERQGFLYDHFGTADPTRPQYFYDILDPALGVQFPPTWLGRQRN